MLARAGTTILGAGRIENKTESGHLDSLCHAAARSRRPSRRPVLGLRAAGRRRSLPAPVPCPTLRGTVGHGTKQEQRQLAWRRKLDETHRSTSRRRNLGSRGPERDACERRHDDSARSRDPREGDRQGRGRRRGGHQRNGRSNSRLRHGGSRQRPKPTERQEALSSVPVSSRAGLRTGGPRGASRR